MKTTISAFCLCLFFLLVRPAGAIAQAAGQNLLVNPGTGGLPVSLTPADLDQLEQTELTRTDKDGKNHIYKGVLLQSVLIKAGMGPVLKGKALLKYVLVEAADGYKVIFALAELDPAFTPRRILLADKMDGAALDPAEGPLRIIVEDEKKQARCIRQVTAIRVQTAE